MNPSLTFSKIFIFYEFFFPRKFGMSFLYKIKLDKMVERKEEKNGSKKRLL